MTLPALVFQPTSLNQRASLARTSSASSSNGDVKSAWREFKTDEGKSYFYNKITKQTTWKNPLAATGENPPAATPAADPWKECKADDGRTYFFNRETKETSWSNPHIKSAPNSTGNPAGRALPKSTSSFARAEPNRLAAKTTPAMSSSPRDGSAPPQISKDAQIKGLQEKIEEIKGEIKKKMDTKKGLEKLAGFYNSNVDAVSKAKTEAEALGQAIKSLKSIRDKYIDELEELCPGTKKEAAPKPTVSPWKEVKSENGIYYYNLITKETVWEKPEGFDASAPVTVPQLGASVAKATPFAKAAPVILTPEQQKKQLETQAEEVKQKIKDLINKKKGVEKLVGLYSGDTGAGAQAQGTVKSEVAALQKQIDDLKAKKHSLLDELEKKFPGSVQKKEEKPKVNPWKKIESADGAYYYNLLTKETSWENPNPEEDVPEPQPEAPQTQPEPHVEHLPLPAGWTEVTDDDGAVYYYNSVTGESSWERPGESSVVPPAPVEMRVEALYDHVAQNDQELTFYTGEIITITKNDDGEWWYGHIGDRVGFLPKNFVREL
eukprot:TRINITY_DN2168_c0_g1_i1.p1 TRINITY_DN2168_c0_g1~~TRINITY_DN2168_c0_g1_i1.p1  ORF type:complete len:619 (+),score=262.34 TRINITY_DN2168_c0_g1_i1:213-1859(+)